MLTPVNMIFKVCGELNYFFKTPVHTGTVLHMYKWRLPSLKSSQMPQAFSKPLVLQKEVGLGAHCRNGH